MSTRTHVAGALVHFDIAGPDEAALRAFYGATFGWAVDVQGPGYALVRTPDGSADGAIVDADEPAITIGIAVADLEATIAAAGRRGRRGPHAADRQRLGRQGPGHRPGRQPRHARAVLSGGGLDERLRALAHPARRQIVRACLQHEHAAGELVALTGLPNPSVSEHLKVLRKTGLVEQSRDGRFRRYRTDADALRAVLTALADLGSL